MNKNILNTGVQVFINDNIDADIVSVLLKKPFFEHISNKEIAQQIISKKKCRTKLQTWFNSSNIYYPDKLNIEQTSSEKTAAYKSDIVAGKSLIDLTGGLGVDTYYFSKKMNSVFHCEVDGGLSEIASHNFKVLGGNNIRMIAGDGLDFLKSSTSRFDWIYLDPSRRDFMKGKVFKLDDCRPNVPEYLDLLFEKAENIMVKTSPLLDVTQGIRELKFVKEIHIVSVDNEVKEILWILKIGFTGEIKVKTVNLKKKSKQQFEFQRSAEKTAISQHSNPLTYLYEPNAAILKSGAFKTIGNRFALYKLADQTHLYTSEKHIEFPGRRFKVEKTFPYKRNELEKAVFTKANITVRNFPLTVSQIRKRHNIEEGGNIYLFFCRTINNAPMVIACVRI